MGHLCGGFGEAADEDRGGFLFDESADESYDDVLVGDAKELSRFGARGELDVTDAVGDQGDAVGAEAKFNSGAGFFGGDGDDSRGALGEGELDGEVHEPFAAGEA